MHIWKCKLKLLLFHFESPLVYLTKCSVEVFFSYKFLTFSYSSLNFPDESKSRKLLWMQRVFVSSFYNTGSIQLLVNYNFSIQTWFITNLSINVRQYISKLLENKVSTPNEEHLPYIDLVILVLKPLFVIFLQLFRFLYIFGCQTFGFQRSWWR